MKEIDLAQFTGTENYYEHNLGRITYTDGIKYLAEKAGAYWLIDLIESYQPRGQASVPFQIWTLEVIEKEGERGAVATMREDTDTPVLIRQEIEYTDFPLDKIKLYLVDGVLMLPSEN